MIYVESVFKILRKKNEKATRFKNFHIFRDSLGALRTCGIGGRLRKLHIISRQKDVL